MTYLRLPNSRLPGRALSQTPTANGDAGILPVTLDADIATTSSLGVVQVGSGLSITPEGILSANGGGGGMDCATTYVNRDYAVQPGDYYIGVVGDGSDPIAIVLPLATTECRIIVIKDQRKGRADKIKVIAQLNNKIDGDSDVELQQPYESITVLGQGSAWWIISKVQQ